MVQSFKVTKMQILSMPNSHNNAIQQEHCYGQILKHYSLISGNQSPLPFSPFLLARVLPSLISRVHCCASPLRSSAAVSQHNSGCWWCFYADNHQQLHKTKLHTGSLGSLLQRQYKFSLLLAVPAPTSAYCRPS